MSLWQNCCLIKAIFKHARCQEVQLCAAIINIFHLIPAASKNLIEPLTALVLAGEKTLLMEVSYRSCPVHNTIYYCVIRERSQMTSTKKEMMSFVNAPLSCWKIKYIPIKEILFGWFLQLFWKMLNVNIIVIWWKKELIFNIKTVIIVDWLLWLILRTYLFCHLIQNTHNKKHKFYLDQYVA